LANQVGLNCNPTYNHNGLWEEKREHEKEFINRQPTVIVIGVGHVRLEVAAHLKYLGVLTLIVEQRPCVGIFPYLFLLPLTCTPKSSGKIDTRIFLFMILSVSNCSIMKLTRY
jgi:hypothetical protein